MFITINYTELPTKNKKHSSADVTELRNDNINASFVTKRTRHTMLTTRQKWDIKVQTLVLTGAKWLFVVVLVVCDSWTLKAQALQDYQALDPFKLTLVANKSNQAEFALKATTFKRTNVFYDV